MTTDGIAVGMCVFKAEAGKLWLQLSDASASAVPINLVPKARGQQDVVGCSQAPGPTPGSIKLCLVVSNGVRQNVLHALVRNVQHVIDTRTLSFGLFKTLISSAVPVGKVTHADDGVFISADNGALHYAQIDTPSVQLFQLAVGGAPGSASASSGPLADVLAAKDAIATFVNNLSDQLPKMVAAVEHAVSQEILTALGTAIKAQQQNLDKVFDKPLASFVSQHNQTAQVAAMASSAAAPSSVDAGTRRLLLEKLGIQRYLDTSAVQPTRVAPAAALLAQPPTAAPDPLEALGKLFEPFSTLLKGDKLQALSNTGVADLLEAISGSKPFSSVLDDFFNVFKIDEAMTAFHTVLGGGQLSALVGQLSLKSYLAQPVQNAFFTALYQHYFPGKIFTSLDLLAFLAALVGFLAFEVQGKEPDFQSVFADPQRLAEFTNAPATLVSLIGGTPPHLVPVQAAPALVQAGAANALVLASDARIQTASLSAAPPVWRIAVASVLSGVCTLFIGVLGVLSFGTGLIASPMVGGFAGGICQGLFGIFQNCNLDDVKWDLLSGFAGGFSGGFVSTLIGNNLFGVWAQHGASPSARINKLQLIMSGFVLTLGGGGGAVVSALIKNYAKTGKIDFDDPLALTTGAVAGLGGGAMGCGLHFMGNLSGGSCLPVPLSLVDANARQMQAIVGPPTMNNATPLSPPNPAFPAAGPLPSVAVYRTVFDAPLANPPDGVSIAFVKRKEFSDMDDDPNVPLSGYVGRRERLFWLEANAAGNAPGRVADIVVGVHGIGRYVFPVLAHRSVPPGTTIEFTRPMHKDDFADFLAGQPAVGACLARVGQAGRTPVVKLLICFSALPLGCCSLGQRVATRLNATVYAGRPPVYPWLTNGALSVPGWGGWIQYNP